MALENYVRNGIGTDFAKVSESSLWDFAKLSDRSCDVMRCSEEEVVLSDTKHVREAEAVRKVWPPPSAGPAEMLTGHSGNLNQSFDAGRTCQAWCASSHSKPAEQAQHVASCTPRVWTHPAEHASPYQIGSQPYVPTRVTGEMSSSLTHRPNENIDHGSAEAAISQQEGSFSGGGGIEGIHGKEADKKNRVRWSEEMHKVFVRVIEEMKSEERVTPKGILRRMGPQWGLSTSHIKSHLQKYRAWFYTNSSKCNMRLDHEGSQCFATTVSTGEILDLSNDGHHLAHMPESKAVRILERGPMPSKRPSNPLSPCQHTEISTSSPTMVVPGLQAEINFMPEALKSQSSWRGHAAANAANSHAGLSTDHGAIMQDKLQASMAGEHYDGEASGGNQEETDMGCSHLDSVSAVYPRTLEPGSRSQVDWGSSWTRNIKSLPKMPSKVTEVLLKDALKLQMKMQSQLAEQLEYQRQLQETLCAHSAYVIKLMNMNKGPEAKEE